MTDEREPAESGNMNPSGSKRPSAQERRERFEAVQAEKTRREIGRFHKRDFVYIGLLCALIFIAVLILMSMRNLRGGSDVKVIVPPTAAVTAAAQSATAPPEAAPAPYIGGETAGQGSGGVLVNINTAGTEELKALPGIGDKRASDIIDYRNANGAFNDIRELTNVPGIGESILEQLKDKITV